MFPKKSFGKLKGISPGLNFSNYNYFDINSDPETGYSCR